MIDGDPPRLIDEWIRDNRIDYRNHPLRYELFRRQPDLDEVSLDLGTLQLLWLQVHRQNYREIVETCWQRFTSAIYDAIRQAKSEE